MIAGAVVQHLHAVDAEIVSGRVVFARRPGNHDGPGDERPRVARPAGLHRQLGQIRRSIGPSLRCGDEFRPRLQGRARRREKLAGFGDGPGRLRRAHPGHERAKPLQIGRNGAKARRHALPRPEQIGNRGQAGGPARRDRPLEAQHRPARGDHAPVHLGNLKVHIDGRGDGPHAALAVEIGKEGAQVREKGQAAAVHKLKSLIEGAQNPT